MSGAPTRLRPGDPVAEATRIQREVADPRVSAAVSAGAGSGKTHVLVERIIRLCLAGADPQTIVAVTFTRKAAVEIKARLLKELRSLAAADDAVRRTALRERLGREPEAAELARAARLYDRFLEDLPGLPIGTIHAWCQRLLGRFAADLGLDPSFVVVEKPEELWAEALDRLEAEATADPQARAALAQLASSPPQVREALTGLFADRLALDRWLGRLADTAGVPALATDRHAFHAAMAADLARAAFRGTPLAGATDPGAADVAAALIAATERLAAAARGPLATIEPKAVTAPAQAQLDAFAATLALARAWGADPDGPAGAAAFAELRLVLLTQDGKLRALKGGKAALAQRQAAYAAAARGALEALALIDLLALCRHNGRLLRFGLRALDIYEALKRRDRVVDFHDLERLARHLVARSDQKEWIQYRLDAATEHLLVDEFQDTNHNQWDVLEPLAAEFLAGAGAHATPPTVFVVGDVKQSIYRFRGAEPRLFGQVERRLAALGEAPGAPIRALRRSLPTNFRSVPAVVETAGRLFGAEPLGGLLPDGEAARVAQAASRAAGPDDEVLFVPPFEAQGDAGGEREAAGDSEAGGATDDEDTADAGPIERAALAAARVVLRLRATGRVAEPSGAARPLAWSDVLVLCRHRTHIGAYEEALRRAGVPVVPSGRGALARSREVQDVLLLLRWLAFPDDDPALASVLRSPLLRVSETQLQRALALRHGRRDRRGFRRTLWTVLRTRGEKVGLTETARLLTAWRRHAGVEGCHDLLRRIYRDADAPERFAAALGEQARWNLLRLHDLALALDLGPHPSLRRFADLIARAAETSAEEEATLPEQGEGQVRVMTVHAAKGLEAPAVLLVDAAAPLRRGESRVPLEPGNAASPILYGLKKALRDGPALPADAEPIRPGALAAAVPAAARAVENEDADILYVALTRARDRLYVLGSRGKRAGDRPHYLAWLHDALADATRDGPPPPARWERPAWLDEPAPTAGTAASAGDPSPSAPDVTVWEAPPKRARFELRTPSSLAPAGEAPADDEGGAERRDTRADALAAAPADAPPSDLAAAAARGTAIHLWLRMAAEPGGLPPDDGALLGDAPAPGWTADALAEARAVAANPALAWIFRPERDGGRGWSEAPLIHRLPPERPGAPEIRVHGAIDRLVVRGNRVDVIDYKSNRLAGDAARVQAELARLGAHYAPQLAAYRAAAAALFPGREAHAHVVFTNARDTEGRQGLLWTLDAAAGA